MSNSIRSLNFHSLLSLATISAPMQLVVSVAESDRNLDNAEAKKYNDEYWPKLIQILQHNMLKIVRDEEEFKHPDKFVSLLQSYAEAKGYKDISLLCDSIYSNLDEVLDTLRESGIVMKQTLCDCEKCVENPLDATYWYDVDIEASQALKKQLMH